MSNSGKHLGWLKKAETALRWKQYKQAVAAYDKAIKAKPNCAEAWLGKGETLLELRLLADAVVVFDQYIKLVPDHIQGYFYKGTTLEELELPEAALACYVEATDRLPDDAGAWFFRGLHHNRLQQFEAALPNFDKAIELAPNPMNFASRSLALEKLGRYGEALEDMDRSAAFGDFFVVEQNRGKLLEQLNRPEEAITSYQKAISLAPHMQELWEDLSRLLEALDRTEEALALYPAAANSFEYAEDAWDLQAQMLTRLKRYDEAISAYTVAIALNNQIPSFHYDIAVCLIQKHSNDLPESELQEVVRRLKHAVFIEPEDFGDLVSTDPILAPLRSTEAFQRLWKQEN
jgi:tetratricopeptide (TPR) repeat protein